MHEPAPGPRVAHGRRDLLGRQGRREGEVAAGQGLADAEDVGDDARGLAGPPRAGAPEAGGDLVVDRQQPVLAGHLGEGGDGRRVVGVHAARALEDRLDDHRGELVGVPGGEVADLLGPGVELLGVGAGTRGSRGEDVLGEGALPQRVHAAVRVGHRHRREGVAVVAAADREESGAAPLAATDLRLEGHLHRDLDRDRAGVGEEDPGQRLRGHLDEPLDEADRGLVGQPAEHHVAHRVQLRAGGGVELRDPVAVDRAPPARHAVDDLAAGAVRVDQAQVDPLRALDEVGR